MLFFASRPETSISSARLNLLLALSRPAWQNVCSSNTDERQDRSQQIPAATRKTSFHFVFGERGWSCARRLYGDQGPRVQDGGSSLSAARRLGVVGLGDDQRQTEDPGLTWEGEVRSGTHNFALGSNEEIDQSLSVLIGP